MKGVVVMIFMLARCRPASDHGHDGARTGFCADGLQCRLAPEPARRRTTE